MVDIVERLRGLPIIVTENGRTGISRMGGALLSEAADEIERLREALQEIAAWKLSPDADTPIYMANIAEDALKGEKSNGHR